MTVSACPHMPESQGEASVRATESRSATGDIFRLSRAPMLTLRQGTDKRLPGPKGLPVLGVSPSLMRDPFNYLVQCQRRYGDIFRVPVPIWDLVIVAHPDLVKEVFHDRGEQWGSPDLFRRAEPLLGMPFPGLDGDRYAERRNIVAPMFGKRYLTGLAPGTIEEFEKHLNDWDRFADTGEVVNLEDELARIILPAFLRSMFSMSITEEEFERYNHDLRTVLAIFATVAWTKPPPNILPLPGRPNAARSARRMYRTIAAMYDERKAQPSGERDLFQVLLDARLKDGSPLRRRDVLYDTMGLMVAGYDTVVAAMCWMLAYLPTNPQAEQKLFDEIDALGGKTPTADDLNKLTWIKACFDEGQRLQGHPFNMRFSKADNTLAGFRIPKGTMIGACMTALNRDPRWWANPNQFDPNHFADKEQVAARPKTAFIPFGTGPHQCVGMAMAYMNAQLLTTLIFQRYRIQRLPGWEPRHNASMAVTMKGGFPCTITRRQDG